LAIALLATAALAASAQESVIYSFGQFADGRNPQSAPLFDASGNMYGTSNSGGLPGEPYFNSNGIVWELTPASGGTWTETVLYNFGTVTGDGSAPGGGLLFDAAGNLYGVTTSGGTGNLGVVFELTPGASAGGAWTETPLYSFKGGTADGASPQRVTLVRDAKGFLYGTTEFGGTFGSNTTGGTVFELIPGAGGTWTEQLIYSFGSGSDAAGPMAGLTLDAGGNIYGTTYAGGQFGGGTVFELSPAAGGTWKEKVLHSFNEDGVDGKNPYAPLILDSRGNLYGTTYGGGANPSFLGIVFELSPSASGEWTEEVLHTFTGDPNGTAPVPDVDFPYGGLAFDAAGNLYGAGSSGGTGGHGGVFVMTPGPSGWTEKLLYSFGSTAADGHVPEAGLAFDATGTLYGTTTGGGTNSVGLYGTVFKIAGVTAAKPKFSPAPGAYTTAQSVTISDATSGATIYYTLNGGATPAKYTAPIGVSASTIITAYATSSTLPRSQPATGGYQIGSVTATPEFTPAAGTYTLAQSVTIADADPHAAVYYTTDGSTPTISSTKYTKAIAVTKTETINAIAAAAGLTDSAVATAAYTIAPVTPPSESVLYNFGVSTSDGVVPSAGLIFDSKGNLYGTTTDGGSHGKGTVYELSPPASGTVWTETILYNFGVTGTDAAAPTAALVFDSKGNLYGTTAQGGGIGQGTVFELSPPASGTTWTETILWSFGLATTDGEVPEAGLIFDSKGNLYGTTEQGGANTTWAAGSGGWGTVFELSPPVSGAKWTEKILYAFGYLSQTDGYFPTAGVLFDSAGNLYGATSDGGAGQDLEGGGTVFELSPTTTGPWKETVLYSFGGGSPNGYSPEGGLVRDAAGNLYGTANLGGNGFGLDGVLFEISAASGGGRTETVLHSFGAYETDGINPTSTLLFDAKGNLYGTTYNGGANQSGMVYELSPQAGGPWTEQPLFNFGATATAPAHPYAGLLFNSTGQLFGTTEYGGTHGSSSTGGTVFEVKTSATVGGTPTVTLTPASLTFASTAVGATTAAQDVTLKNTSAAAALTIGGITFTGTNPGSFTKTTTCAASLAASASCTISVSFKPAVTGALSAKLSVADNAGGSPQTVSLTGTGLAAPAITLSPTSISFPNTPANTVSAAQIITVKNAGTVSATISSIVLGGTNPAAFRQVNTCTATLAAGASCIVYVAFKPASAAAFTATLSITDNAAGSPQKVTLTGTGVADANLTLSPGSLAFPATTHGVTSAAKTITVTNAGTTAATISAITISGVGAGSFIQLNTCGAALAPAATCTIAVVFTPATTGALTATLNVASPGIAKTATLTGTGD
jgi:uncharacterized repeat protein (TIGR03803 family)